MNSPNKDHFKVKDDLQHKIKLANALPVTIVFISLAFAGWLFESDLEATYSNTIAVSLLPDNKGNNEEESVQQTSAANDKTNNAGDQLYQSMIASLQNDNSVQNDISVQNEKIFYLLSESEVLQAKTIAVKRLKSNRYYQQALEIIMAMTQQQQEFQQLIFSKAYVLAKLGNLTAATASYEHLLSIQKNHQAANINLGLLYLELGETKKAEQVFSRGVLQTAGLKKAKNYFGLGDAYLQQKKYPLAHQSYSKSIEYFPAYAPSWRRLGKVSRYMDNHKLASDSYQKSISLDKNNLRTRVEYADYLNSRLQYVKAIEQLKTAKKIDRESFSIRLKLAFSFLHAGKPINARKQLNLAKKNIQNETEKSQSEAIQKYLAERYREAINILKGNLEKEANNSFEYYLIALSYTSLEKFKLAKNYLDKIASDSDYYYQGRYLLAKSLLDNGHFAESVEIFRTITSAIADNYIVLNQASRAEQMSQNYQQAVELVNMALKLRTDRRLLLRKADLYWLSGEQSAAIRQLEKIVEDYPSYLRAIYHLASYNHKLDKRSEAIAGFENLLEKRASYGDAQYQLAVIFYEQADFLLSQDLLAAYLLKKPDSKRTRLLYARTFCETGQSQSCKEQLELVLKIAPGYKPALELQESLR